jgi:hypothetical protein
VSSNGRPLEEEEEDSNELLSVNTLHEHKLSSRSRRSKQFFVSIYCIYSVNTGRKDVKFSILFKGCGL